MIMMSSSFPATSRLVVVVVVVVTFLLSTILVTSSISTSRRRREQHILVVNGEDDTSSSQLLLLRQQQQEGSKIKNNRFDKHWTEYNRNDFWYSLDCPEVFNRGEENSALIPTDASFHYLRDTYRALVGLDHSSILPIEELTTSARNNNNNNEAASTSDDSLKNKNSVVSSKYVGYGGRGGFQVHVDARRKKKKTKTTNGDDDDDDDHGRSGSSGLPRGIFTLQTIPKGTLVYKSEYTARFPSGDSYRKFLLSIAPDLACEVMPWTYIQDLSPPTTTTSFIDGEKQNEMVISLDMDYGALINSGIDYEDGTLTTTNDDDDIANIGCIDKDSEGNCIVDENDGNNYYYALRDIQINEELFVNHDSIFNTQNNENAWKDINLHCNVCDSMTA